MNKEYKCAIQEKRFEYKGFPCVVVMMVMGFRTGYVGIPKGHKLYGVHYGNISISCHGGLTYSSNYLIDHTDEDIWWIGFDTGHWGDGYDYEAALKLFKDYPETIKQIQLMKKTQDAFGSTDFENARSLEYVEQELKDIIEQLENIPIEQ